MNNHFPYLYWFCVGVFLLSFGAMMTLLFCEIPEANREMASNAQGFLQGSLIMSAVGFLLTGNINTLNKKPAQTEGTTTADISISTTTKANEDIVTDTNQ